MNDNISHMISGPWLRAGDLIDGPIELVISGAEIETRDKFRGEPGETEDVLNIEFRGDDRRLTLNKTNLRTLASATGSLHYRDYYGWRVRLERVEYGVGAGVKLTVIAKDGRKKGKGKKAKKARLAPQPADDLSDLPF